MDPNSVADSKCLADKTAHRGKQHEVEISHETEGIEQAFGAVLEDPNFSGWGHEVLQRKQP